MTDTVSVVWRVAWRVAGLVASMVEPMAARWAAVTDAQTADMKAVGLDAQRAVLTAASTAA